MKLGYVKEALPRAIFALPLQDSKAEVEFIVDTGFDGELALPNHIIRQLPGSSPAGQQSLLLADGSFVTRPFYRIEIDWDGERLLAEALGLEGNPLIGTALLSEKLLTLEMTEGGEVTIEPL